MPYLQIENISKSFGGINAVTDVSLHVNKGEIVSVIGPNGAGKTTIFNLITGVYTVDAGRIIFDGKEISNLRPQRIVEAGITRTFQNIRLFSDLRVVENVLVGTHIKTRYSLLDSIFRTRKFRRIEDEQTLKAIRILQNIGLDDRRNDYASSLPYGDQRKLEIARAIATGASLILLDEPAAGMNPKESQELLEFIGGLKRQGYTIILIEHDMNVVMNISDRIYVLDHGAGIAEGAPSEIVSNEKVIEAYLGVVKRDA